MRILAIETTTFTGSLALLEQGGVVAECPLPPEQRSAQSLAPAIHQLLTDQSWPIESLRLIAVAQGPGSFTGLRVGIATAKALAYALGTEVLGIDTLEVLAHQTPLSSSCRVHAVLDAQRNQLFAATFFTAHQPDASARDEAVSRFPLADASGWCENSLVRQTPTLIVDLEPWLANLQPGDCVIGPMLTKIAPRLPGHVVIADPRSWEPHASTVGQLAWRDYSAGRRDDLWKLVPEYYRSSAAEEKATQRSS